MAATAAQVICDTFSAASKDTSFAVFAPTARQAARAAGDIAEKLKEAKMECKVHNAQRLEFKRGDLTCTIRCLPAKERECKGVHADYLILLDKEYLPSSFVERVVLPLFGNAGTKLFYINSAKPAATN